MKTAHRHYAGKGGLELIEEAVHLLRRAPVSSLAHYYVGTLPFVLGLLYFWADMSRNPFGRQHLAGASLGLALAYFWMKVWQARFASGLRGQISPGALAPWSPGSWWRALVIQATLQPTAVLILPLALLPAAVPFAWVYAFYENVTALADGETGEVGIVFKRAWQQSRLWPRQNFIILGSLLGFGFFVFINWITAGMTVPGLLKMLLGLDSVYSRSPTSLLNTTFIAVCAGLTYLSVDPILKTVYLLRCFYGEALCSGEDLKAELRRFPGSPRLIAAGMMLLFALACAVPLRGADAPGVPAPVSAPAGNISPSGLDHAIDDVIRQPKYAWRLPRDQAAPKEAEGFLARFINSAWDYVKAALRAVWEWIKDVFDRLFRTRSRGASGGNWIGPLQASMYLLITLAVCALAIVILRVWRRRLADNQPLASEPILPVPDLADDNLGADQLPEDGWIKLGRELLARGELRLALRAFYFASLAHLAGRGLITIARFKSNRDYERELRRRSHALPELLPLFGDNVIVFERSWYGRHAVDPQGVGQFLSNVERIKTLG